LPASLDDEPAVMRVLRNPGPLFAGDSTATSECSVPGMVIQSTTVARRLQHGLIQRMARNLGRARLPIRFLGRHTGGSGTPDRSFRCPDIARNR
jgi:hypothetical protein